MKLALVGDAPYAEDYIRQVRNTEDPRVVMPGAIYGLGYGELGSWCFAYVHATEVGGTHPALIEAMGRGALVLYLDTPENTEVCGNAGLPYKDQAGLTARMREAIAMSEMEREKFRMRAIQRVRDNYNWDDVTTQYEKLLLSLRR
jgi:glycosyltransferase involved in cell wall biosynthesis